MVQLVGGSGLLHEEAVCSTSQARADARSQDFQRGGLDFHRAAKLRLDQLVNRVQGDGELELIESMLRSEPPESKLLLGLLSGSIITAGALFVCWLSGSNPAGGAHLSVESVRAAAIGLLTGAPIAALYAALWTPEARKAFPALEDMHKAECEPLDALFEGMSAAQRAAMMISETIPMTIMLMPAAQGALAQSFETYSSYLRDMGWAIPGNLPAALALTTTAAVAGLARLLEHGISPEEYNAVQSAVQNADRYYKVMGTEASKDPVTMANAFKAEAADWVGRQQLASHVGALLVAFEVTFLGILWRETGDLAAPAAAYLLLNGVSVQRRGAYMRENK
ncbi:hypothetical protein CVIRNUC_010211 [Coccomyxa viridis]|uniref:Type II secretion system protein GspF domain-containing protein n=1 Tax=Coccomyxa viridis TaxID=1274662 RepID=A0AAV1ILR9_9CHLO|nr:hypothetical protein CVIRNUC_010211 [Coccomyxa viridis]